MKRLLNCILFFCIYGSVAAQQRFSDKRPNIVFILADDLGYGDLGVYGQTKIETPNIDKLAQTGIRFTNFYSGAPVCAPSRSALLTGQHTGHTYIRGNKEIEPEGQEPLADSVQTFAMLLQQAGYVTGAFGKWGLGMVNTSGAPERKGFNEFYGYNCQRHSHRYYPTHLWHNDVKVELKGNNLKDKAIYAPDLIQEQTLSFIDKNKDKPFFLFVPTVLPHAELAGPLDSLYQKYEGRFEEKPHTRGSDYGLNATVAGYAPVEKPRAMFASMVNRMDVYVGQIIDRLDKLGLLENTIIMFSSDNGAHREGGADPEFFNSSGGFRGYKRDVYEGGVRVPFIASWPSVIKAGQSSSHTAAFWDIMPTLTELAQTAKPRYTDGISFLPTLLDKGKQKKHKYLYWEFHENNGRQALLTDNWKLVVLDAKDKNKSKIELYNLNEDPQERNNVAQKESKRVKNMLDKIERVHVESPVFKFYTN